MNIPAITPQGRRVAQAALELCVSLERRDFVLHIQYVFECRACGVTHIDAVEIEAA